MILVVFHLIVQPYPIILCDGVRIEKHLSKHPLHKPFAHLITFINGPQSTVQNKKTAVHDLFNLDFHFHE